MLSTKYRLENLNLINSLTIKSNTVALAMNKYLNAYGVIVSDDKTTWPFYLNISGEAHSANTPILINSIETNTSMELTVDNLTSHQITKNELLKYSDFFNDVIKENPGQSLYIRGILNPIDINTAIDAIDGTILYHRETYLSYNEVSIIEDLNRVSTHFVDRWDIPEYLEIEDLYASSMYVTLISHLIKRIFMIRFGNIQTVEINDNYMFNVLGSTFGIGTYATILNNSSRLWLVKNIKFLTHNIGKDLILDKINKHIVKPNGVDMMEIGLIKRPTTNILEEDSHNTNTLYNNDTIRVIDKTTGEVVRNINHSDINSLQPINVELRKDYAVGSYNYGIVDEKLKYVINEERSKFFLLHRNEHVTFTKSILSNIAIESAILYYNNIDGPLKDSSVSILNHLKVRYDILGSDISKYLIYSGYKLSGKEIPISEYGDELRIKPVHLLDSNMNIDLLLSNIKDDTSMYRTILEKVKGVLLEINTNVSIDSFISAQLEAYDILVSCNAFVGSGLQKGQMNNLIYCMTMGERHILNKVKVDDIVKNTTISTIFKDYNVLDIQNIITASTNIKLSSVDDVIKLLNGLKLIISKLTSYNVEALSSYSFSDDFIIKNKMDVLEGINIIGNVDANIMCGLVKANYSTVAGDDDNMEVIQTLSPILRMYDRDVFINNYPVPIMHIEHRKLNNEIRIESPILVSR